MEEIYDETYSELYDDLVLNGLKIDYELGKILEIMGSKNKKFLDVGCGTGEHVGKLSNMNVECTGLDLSPAMINKAKDKYSKVAFSDNSSIGKILLKTLSKPFCKLDSVRFLDDKN